MGLTLLSLVKCFSPLLQQEPGFVADCRPWSRRSAAACLRFEAFLTFDDHPASLLTVDYFSLFLMAWWACTLGWHVDMSSLEKSLDSFWNEDFTWLFQALTFSAHLLRPLTVESRFFSTWLVAWWGPLVVDTFASVAFVAIHWCGGKGQRWMGDERQKMLPRNSEEIEFSRSFGAFSSVRPRLQISSLCRSWYNFYVKSIGKIMAHEVCALF